MRDSVYSQAFINRGDQLISYVVIGLYPAYSLLSILLYAVFGSKSPLFYNSIQILISISLCVAAIKTILKDKTNINSFFCGACIIIFYSAAYVILSKKWNAVDLIQIYLPMFLALVFISTATSKASHHKNTYAINDKFVTYYIWTAVFVAITGYVEKIFISDELIAASAYPYFVSQGKGFESGELQENLYSMISGFEYRRMIGMVGDPLYFSYFIFPASVFSYFTYKKTKGILDFMKFFLLATAVMLSLSRYIIAILAITVFFDHVVKITNLKTAVAASVFAGFISTLLFAPYISTMQALDASFAGHLDSLATAFDRLGGIGWILPSDQTVMNNFISKKLDNQDLGVESGGIILLSSVGIIGLVLFYLKWFKIIVFQFTRHYSAGNEEANGIAYISLGYMVTTVMSPQLFTFQNLFFVIALQIGINIAASAREYPR